MSMPRQGRILRLKIGYNPNSSSIGTIVFAMPAALLGLTVAFGAAAGLLSTRLLQGADPAADDPDPAADEDGSATTAERADGS